MVQGRNLETQNLCQMVQGGSLPRYNRVHHELLMPRPFQSDQTKGTSQTGGLDPIEIAPVHSATPAAASVLPKKICHVCLRWL